METKNKFSLLKDKMSSITTEEAPPLQQSSSVAVRLANKRGRAT